MPTYEYRCKDCGVHLEVVQAFTDDALTECEACGGDLRKVFGSVGISFKGSGFYKNDSRPAAKSGSAGSGSDGSGSEGSSSDGGSSGEGATKAEPSSAGADKAAKAPSKGSDTTAKPAAPAASASSS